MEGRKFRAARALLGAAAIVLAAVAQSVYLAVCLAVLILVVEFGRMAWERREEKAAKARLEKELEGKPWKLVPGPGA